PSRAFCRAPSPRSPWPRALRPRTAHRRPAPPKSLRERTPDPFFLHRSAVGGAAPPMPGQAPPVMDEAPVPSPPMPGHPPAPAVPLLLTGNPLHHLAPPSPRWEVALSPSGRFEVHGTTGAYEEIVRALRAAPEP